MSKRRSEKARSAKAFDTENGVASDSGGTLDATFASALQRELNETRNRHKLKQPQDAFPYWICTQILGATDAEAIEACSPEGGNDKGIDFLLIDRDENKVIIGQTKYNENLSVNVKESHVNALLTSLQWVKNPSLLQKEGKEDLAQLAQDYIEAIESGYTTELWFIYTALAKPNIERLILAFNSDNNRNSDSTKARHVHVGALKELWGDLNYLPTRVAQIEIRPVNGKFFEHSSGFGRAVVCSISGSQLKHLYQAHGDKLFERNVRLYLGSKKGSVNSGIETTLKNEAELGNFWAYNNGISILADSFDLTEDQNCIIAKNVSIINGCQTSVSIAKHLMESKDVSVLCRVISADRGIIDNVIQFNNSQNQVKAWDVAALDITQRRLVEEFQNLKQPYIYLTRRGAKPRGDLRRYRDDANRLRQMRFDEVGQYIAAFGGHPLIAYKAKAEIFSSMNAEIFPPDITAVEVLFYWNVGQAVSTAIDELMEEEGTNKFALRRGGKIFVAWVVGFLFIQRNGPAYREDLTEERVFGRPLNEALSKYAKFAATVYPRAFETVAKRDGGDLTRLNWSQKFLDDVRSQIQTDISVYKLAAGFLDEALPVVLKRKK